MRVGIVVGSLHGGGAERQAAILYRQLCHQHEVRLVSLSTRNDYLEVAETDDVHFLEKIHRADALLLTYRLRRLLADMDVVICFHWYPHLLVRLAVPKVSRISRYGNPVGRDIDGWWRLALARWCQRSAFGTVGVSRGVVRDVCATLGSPVGVCGAIPNALDFCATDVSDSPVWPRPFMVCPARMCPQKDHPTLLEAFALIADAVPHDLVLAGEGPDVEMLTALAVSRGIAERVHFVGFQSDLPPWLSSADVTVLASRWEGFGSVIIESMIVGTPVVCTDAPFGPSEIFDRVPGGILVPVGDARRLADAMLDVVSERNWALMSRVELASAARASWSPEATRRAYEDIIEAAFRG